MSLLLRLTDPSSVLVKTISYEEAYPIVTVTHKTGIALKNFHTAEMLDAGTHYLEIFPVHTLGAAVFD